MKEIIINSPKHGIKKVLVDDADYDLLSQWKWCITKYRNNYYAERSIKVNGVIRNLKMHRFILGLTDPKILCDHKNRNGLHNYRSNLRIATRSQNNANRFSKKYSSSKYLGVYWNNTNKRWVVQIKKDKKRYHLGSFHNEQFAALAYNEAAKRIHGEFANLNKIISD